MLIGTWRKLKEACNNIDEADLDKGVLIIVKDKKHTIEAIKMENGFPIIKNAYCIPDINKLDGYLKNTKKKIKIPQGIICTDKNCNELATHDYNGYGDYCCDYHYKKWNDYFDEEYS